MRLGRLSWLRLGRCRGFRKFKGGQTIGLKTFKNSWACQPLEFVELKGLWPWLLLDARLAWGAPREFGGFKGFKGFKAWQTAALNTLIKQLDVARPGCGWNFLN